MDEVTQQNAAMAEQSSAASRSLSQETVQLASLIGQFKVGSAQNDDAMRQQLQRAAPHAFKQASVAPAAMSGPRGETSKASPRAV
jgi:methyl-accepting chemotaxis protein